MDFRGRLLVAALCAGGLWLFWREQAADTEGPSAAASDARRREASVRALPDQPALALKGTVRDLSGTPIPDAEVHLGSAQPSRLSLLRCPGCGERLIECETHTAAAHLGELLESGEGTWAPAMTVRSDLHGEFVFEGLRAQPVDVWAFAPRFGTATAERVEPGTTIALALPEARELSGTVLAPGGRPLEGATVWAVSHQRSNVLQTRSGRGGVFRFEHVGDGSFTLVATAEGLLSNSLQGVRPDAPSPVIEMRSAQSLVVTVLRDGRPVAARVELTGKHLKRSLDVGPSGVGRFDQVEPEEAQLVARSESLASVPQIVDLAAGENTATLHLHEGGKVWVTVTDAADGRPIPNARLSLGSASEGLFPIPSAKPRRASASVVADERGEALIGPVLAGSYKLNVEADGYDSRSRPLGVGLEDRSVGIELQPLRVLKGRVLDSQGRGVAGATVGKFPSRWHTLTDATGAFTYETPGKGPWTLEARHTSLGWAEAEYSETAEIVNLVLEPRTSLRVTALLDGRPFEGAGVVVFQLPTGSAYEPEVPEELQWRRVYVSDERTGPDGVLWIRSLAAGAYSFSVTDGRGLMSDYILVQLDEGKVQSEVATLARLPSIRGIVVDEEDRPLDGMLVTSGVGQTRTNSTGRFEFVGLKPEQDLALKVEGPAGLAAETSVTAGVWLGEVKLVARKPWRVVRGRLVSARGTRFTRYMVEGKVYTDPDGHFEVRRDPPIFPEETSTLLSFSAPGHQDREVFFPNVQEDVGTVVLEPSDWIEGTVVDSEGVPVEGVEVGSYATFSAITGPDGRFRLEVVEDYPQAEVIALSGSMLARRTVPIPAPNVTLVLEPNTRFTNRVLPRRYWNDDPLSRRR